MPTLRELESWLSNGDVAKRLGVSRPTAIRAAEEGHIRAVRTRLGWLYDPESVEQYRQRRLRRGRGSERESE